MRGMHQIKPISAEAACHSARIPKSRASSDPPGHPGPPRIFDRCAEEAPVAISCS